MPFASKIIIFKYHSLSPCNKLLRTAQEMILGRACYHQNAPTILFLGPPSENRARKLPGRIQLGHGGR